MPLSTYLGLIITNLVTLLGALIYFAYRWGQVTSTLAALEYRLCKIERLLEKGFACPPDKKT